MTEPATQARPSLPAKALGEAVDWLIVLQSPTPAQCRAFDAWLASNPVNAQAYARASAAWGHEAVRSAAQALAATTVAPRRAQRRAPWRRWAAAVLLVLGVVGVVGLGKLPLRLEADYLTSTGERERLSFEDGTQVVLNTETALSGVTTGNRRSARLYQGEAWFDVPGRAGPLELRAGPLLARANDSVFSVRLLGEQTHVQVERGQVDLQDNHHRHLSLGAGMSVDLNPSGFGPTAVLHPDEDLAWLRGRLVFVDRPLRQVVADLSRYYPGWIVTTRTALDDRRVTGNYSVENPVAVLRSLAQATSANLRELPGLMILN